MKNRLTQFSEDFIQQEKLPAQYKESIDSYWVPLAQRIARLTETADTVPVIGINGAQGTGKSTCSACIAGLLELKGLHVLVLSIDDLYLTRAARADLAKTVHPLLATRGVPGTHDMALGQRVIQTARGLDQLTEIPRFDKAHDDRAPNGSAFPEKVDVILLEGWCIGALPAPPDSLETPCNELERDEDADGIWRNYMNEQLASQYAPQFDNLDYLVMLKAPSFEQVYAWRGEQESKLRDRVTAAGGDLSATMDEAELRRFIAHYERLTRWMLSEMPARADEVFELDEAHHIHQHTQKEATHWMVSTDLDATLLTEEYEWQAARPALENLAQAEAYICFNSSKTLAEMAPLFNEVQQACGLQSAPIVAENGGLVAFPDGSVQFVGLPRTTILNVAHQLRTTEKYDFTGFADFSSADLIALTGLDEASAKRALDRKATEPILWHDTEPRFEQFKAQLKAEGIRAIRGGQFIHLMGNNDKVEGMNMARDWCADAHPEFRWSVIALGDSPNDLAMLDAADMAVVIQNPHRAERLESQALDSLYPAELASTGWNHAINAILTRVD